MYPELMMYAMARAIIEERHREAELSRRGAPLRRHRPRWWSASWRRRWDETGDIPVLARPEPSAPPARKAA